MCPQYCRLGPLACLATALLCVTPDAAQGQPRIKSWTTVEGLPQNGVKSIAQTPDGYIWLATRDGLARFDGVRFRVFNRANTPQLPTNRLTAVFADQAGRLWIYPESTNTILLYERGRFTTFQHGRDFQADDFFEPLNTKREMRFRAGGDDYQFVDGRFDRVPARPRTAPSKYFYDETGMVWIDGGDAFYGGRNGDLRAYPKSQPLPFTSRRLNVMGSAEAADSLWFFMTIAGAQRLCRFRHGRLALVPQVYPYPGFVDVDRFGNLWTGHSGFGLLRYDRASLGGDLSQLRIQHVPIGPATVGLAVLSTLKDRDGSIWIGTEQGLRLIGDDPFVTVHSKQTGLADENVYAITQDRSGAIWFGAWDLHLIRFAKGTFTAEPATWVTALLVDRDDRLWMAANPGLRYRERGQWVPVAIPGVAPLGEVAVIAQAQDGAMWFGATNGIVRQSNGVARIFTENDGLPGNAVTSFLQTRAGDIWVGTISGLARFDGTRFQAFTEQSHGLGGNYVRGLYEDRDGTLWIGTYDSGLTRYRDGRFVAIRSRNGLFSDGVFCILEDDDGWFWMNSNQGIHRTRRSELNAFADGRQESVTSVSYGPEDGLIVVEGNGGKHPAALRAADGTMWFPTAGGVAVVDPRRSRPTAEPPHVVLEDAVVDGQESIIGDQITIAPGQSALEIRYTAPRYLGAERIRFRYRLEGLDDRWTEAGTRRFVAFNRLPFGSYTLQVVAADHTGAWSTAPAAVRIVVQAPFYRTTWFFALATASTLALLMLAFSYRVRQLETAHRIRADFTRRLIDSQEAERRRIALELHDSLGQSLAVIHNRAMIGLSTPADHQRLLGQMGEIADASAAALEEAREIAHNLHPAQIDHLGLSTALSSLVASMNGSTSIRITTDIEDVSSVVSREQAINIYRVAQECLTNVIKHSGADRASVTLKRLSGSVQLTVEDNGKGFSSQPVAGLGLTGIRERARILGASVRVEAAPGKGVSITLAVPHHDGVVL